MKIAGVSVQPCSTRGILLVRQVGCSAGANVRVSGGDTTMAGAMSTGSHFYHYKAKALAFSLLPNEYSVTASRDTKTLTLDGIAVEKEAVSELTLRMGHPVIDAKEAVDKVIATQPQLFVALDNQDVDQQPEDPGEMGATERYLLSRIGDLPRPKGKRKKKPGPVAVWQQHPSLSQYQLPVLDLLLEERKHLRTHVAVYTGMRFDFLLLHYFASELLRVLIPGDPSYANVRWLRHPFDKEPGKYRWGFISDMLQNAGGKVDDNNERQAWFLLSCNPHLFGNTLTDAMESSVDYYYDSIGVIDINVRQKFEALLTAAKLLPVSCADCVTKREQVFHSLSEAMEAFRPKGKPGGVLLQIFIPLAMVNEVAYITRTSTGLFTNGTPDPDHPDARATLLRLRDIRVPAKDIPHYSTLQVRLLTPRLIQPSNGVFIREVTQHGIDACGTLRESFAAAAREILRWHAGALTRCS